MLKKVGIVAATATAGLLALSPLAFASGNGHHGHHGHPDEVTNVYIDDESVERNQVNACEFEQEIDGAGLLGPLLAAQQQSLNCVNVGDDSEVPDAPAAPVLPVLPLPLP